MELHEVKMANPNVFIGLDVVKRRPVLTDRNPHVEGLLDVHKCIYLPSSMDKNQYLPQYLNQNITFMVKNPKIRRKFSMFKLVSSRNYQVLLYLLLALLLDCFLPLLNLLGVTYLLHMIQPFINIGF